MLLVDRTVGHINIRRPVADFSPSETQNLTNGGSVLHLNGNGTGSHGNDLQKCLALDFPFIIDGQRYFSGNTSDLNTEMS